MPCVVITGAPGAGKTTLLAELASRGYRTVSESARAIIAERRAAGLSPRPEPEEFAREILRRDIENYTAASATTGWIFFDRAAVEAVAMVNDVVPLTRQELEDYLSRLCYHRRVYILPPWKEIYITDAERDHTFEHAERVHEALMRWYAQCGYALQVVPCQAAEQRALYVLHSLQCSAA